MDFFEAQARAKKRTNRLVFLFALAVIGTVLAGYAAGLFVVNFTGAGGHEYGSWWDGRVFGWVLIGTLGIIGGASLIKWSEFSAGGSAVAASVGARRVDPHTTDTLERRLLNVVEEMAIASGVPVPEVYVLDDESGLNAFAAGLTTGDAIIAVTRGTLEKLSRDELQGVVGHEFSHILNGDMRLNLRITALIFGILVIGLTGRGILWVIGRGRIRGGKNSGGIVVVAIVIGLALFIIGYVGYFFGRLIQAAVSRQREFLADASAVQFTRNPAGITGALKKIGGYSLGSALQTPKAAAIGHFFFAQGFSSGLTGLWDTHPPLPERIRAIDAQWNGEMFTPPTVVDVRTTSFKEAGFARPKNPPPLPPVLAPIAATAAVAAVGTLTSDQIAHAQTLLDAVPTALRESAQTPTGAQALLCGLLLDSDPTVRTRQRETISARLGPEILGALDALDLSAVAPAHKLPVVQLTLPALRAVPATQLTPFLATLEELIRADGRVTPFEFALQKLVTRNLALGQKPAAAIIQIYAFTAVTTEIGLVLSTLAQASTTDPDSAARAFATGAAQLKLIERNLAFQPAADFTALDAALDKLATTSPVIKQRTLVAAAHVVGADGRVLITEAELLRAIAAALDCPMPPLAA
ncbi:MAG: M48 family metallopeptidase [Verrucomicrobia bacterium]|nr:M48 family metallopeptidase [Verrucomicrobiota bacterium]